MNAFFFSFRKLSTLEIASTKFFFNRCANCFDCPSCGNTLSTRATAVAIQSDKTDNTKATQAKKVYYLACGFCRWSSRDVGIEDKSVGEWKYYFMLGSELQNTVVIHSDKRLMVKTSTLFDPYALVLIS